jgi:3-dehydroquinate dehydratase type I
MRDKYCLPIIVPAMNEAIEKIAQYENDYQYFELWLDYIEDVSDDFTINVIKRWPGRIVLVFRRQQLEQIKMPLEQRLEIIRLCHKQPVLIDLDWGSQQLERRTITKEGLDVEIILSHHNYQETPNDSELSHLTSDMLEAKPYILKIATFCNSPDDCVRLLNLLLRLRTQGQRAIILGMGQHGLATRIFGTLWGNEFTFAPPSLAAQSAPGQLTRQQLDAIINIINTKE